MVSLATKFSKTGSKTVEDFLFGKIDGNVLGMLR